MGSKVIIGMFFGLFLYFLFKDLYYYISFFIFMGLILLVKQKQKYNFLVGEIIIIGLYVLFFAFSLLKKDAELLKVFVLLFSNCFSCVILCKKGIK